MDSLDSENQSYQTTPSRNEGSKGVHARKKAFDKKLVHPYKNHLELNSTALAPGSIIDKMPLYTPPKASQHIKNPFEHALHLKEKLSQPVCSPSLFQKVISPIRKSSTFSWSVDEISVLRPAAIDENPSQEFTSWFSPDTETQAQAAIDRFFSSMSQGTLESPLLSRNNTVACQTKLSFPPFLPEAIETELEALSQRLVSDLDESMNTLNSSNCSARRKILPVDVEPPSEDEFDSDVSTSDKDESMRQMFVATPLRPLPHSSPDCSPIPPDSQLPISDDLGGSDCMMEESGFQSQSPSR